MKKIFVLFLIVFTSHANADVDFVPLEMELGYWEITTQMNVDDMLAKIPEAQREMARQMMASKMKVPVIKQCVTEEMYKNMQAKMMDAFKSADNNCDLQVIKSTAKEFSGVVTCAEGATEVAINTQAVNSKRHESQIDTNAGGMGKNNIQTISEWKSATCPEGVE